MARHPCFRPVIGAAHCERRPPSSPQNLLRFVTDPKADLKDCHRNCSLKFLETLDKDRGKFLRDISNVLSQRLDAILQGSFRPNAAWETITSEVVSKMMLDSSELVELCLRVLV